MPVIFVRRSAWEKTTKDRSAGGCSRIAVRQSREQSVAAAVDPSGAFVFVTNAGSADMSVFSINTSTGALTEITGSPFAIGGFPIAVW